MYIHFWLSSVKAARRPIGRRVDGLTGFGIGAEMEAKKPLIILDSPADEGIVMSGSVGCLDRCRECVQRDEFGRRICQVGKIALRSSGVLVHRLASRSPSPVAENEPDGCRRTGGCRGCRNSALACDPLTRDQLSCLQGLDQRLDGVAGSAPGYFLLASRIALSMAK